MVPVPSISRNFDSFMHQQSLTLRGYSSLLSTLLRHLTEHGQDDPTLPNVISHNPLAISHVRRDGLDTLSGTHPHPSTLYARQVNWGSPAGYVLLVIGGAFAVVLLMWVIFCQCRNRTGSTTTYELQTVPATNPPTSLPALYQSFFEEARRATAENRVYGLPAGGRHDPSATI